MKKILFTFLICLITVTGFGQSLFKRGIAVGNTDSTAVVDSITKYGAIFRVYSKGQRIYDDKIIQDAYLVNDVVPIWADTVDVIATKTDLLSVVGSGISGQFYETSGAVGQTGFPSAGDSTDYNSYWIGRKLIVIREGKEIQQHTDNTTEDGFWFDNLTGIVTFRPVLGSGEQLIYRSTSTIQYTTIAPQGDGGAAESTLITGLHAGWKLDETAGTTVNDVLGVYSGTTNADVNQPGKFGVAETFTRANSDYVSLGTTVGDVGLNDFSMAVWVYVSDTAKLSYGIMGNWGAGPNYYLYINEFDYRAKFYFDLSTPIEVDGNAFIPQATWTHIAVTVDRSANAIMYINGVAQTDVESVAADVAVVGDNNSTFNIGNIGDSNASFFFNGSIDDPYIWFKVLSEAEVLEDYNSTHPW